MTKENCRKIEELVNKVRLMHDNLTALDEIIRFDHQGRVECELSKLISKRDIATTYVTKAKWNEKIVSIFHSASAILWNGEHHYKDEVKDIDMDERKEFLREKAKQFLTFEPKKPSWQYKVREATFKTLGL